MQYLFASLRSRYQENLELRTSKLDRNVRAALADEIERSILGQDPGSGSPDSCAREGSSPRTMSTNDGGGSMRLDGRNDFLDLSPSSAGGRTVYKNLDREMNDLEIALEEARERLKSLETSEAFVAQRLSTYRRKISDYKRVKLMQRSSSTTNISDEDDAASDKSDEQVVENGNLLQDASAAEVVGEKCRLVEANLRKVEDAHASIRCSLEEVRRRVSYLEAKQEDATRRRDECRDFVLAVAQAERREGQEEGAGEVELQGMMGQGGSDARWDEYSSSGTGVSGDFLCHDAIHGSTTVKKRMNAYSTPVPLSSSLSMHQNDLV